MNPCSASVTCECGGFFDFGAPDATAKGSATAENAIIAMAKGPKEPHPELAAYMDQVVAHAVGEGIFASSYGVASRFAELLGPDVSRQVVWSWLWSQGGMPRNRIKQLRALNVRVGLIMSDEKLERVLQIRVTKEDVSPAHVLFDEIEKSAIESNMQSHVIRKLLAEYLGVTQRTLFRYKIDGVIPQTKKRKLKEAIISLKIRLPADVMAAVFD